MGGKRPDIVLVEVPPWDPRVPPLGLAYLYAHLKACSFDVRLVDLNIELYNRGEGRGWGNEDFFWWRSSELGGRYDEHFADMAKRILAESPLAVGFSVSNPSLGFLDRLMRQVRRLAPDLPLVVGGPGAFFWGMRREIDHALPDFIVLGEGERALEGLLRGRFHGPPEGLRVWKDAEGMKTVCVNAPAADLDTLPFPDFSGFDLSLYEEGSGSRHFTLPMIFSKGCIRRCTFCSDRVLSRPYRIRRPERVLEEMRTHLAKYPSLYSFRCNDLSLNTDPGFVGRLCDGIIAEGLRIKWYGQAQVRPDMDIALLRRMKEAGCRQLDLGLESLSDHVLALMRKSYNAAGAVRFLKAAKEAGIETNILLIVGYPGETDADFRETLDNLTANIACIDRIGSLNICGMPFGSDLRSHPERHGYRNTEDVAFQWFTTDGQNTYDVRKRRYNEIIRVCRERGIKVECCLDLDLIENKGAK